MLKECQNMKPKELFVELVKEVVYDMFQGVTKQAIVKIGQKHHDTVSIVQAKDFFNILHQAKMRKSNYQLACL